MTQIIMLDNRFWGKVNKTDSCWEWIACINSHGYGAFSLNGKSELSHRLSYENKYEKIPEGLDLDHLCRNRKCVNPDHLEAVTRQTNLLRGDTICAKNKQKTHCSEGHEFTTENTYIRSNGSRKCRSCGRIDCNHRYHRKKMQKGVTNLR